MREKILVLIIEDSTEDAELLIQELKKGGYDPAALVVDSAEKMEGALDRQAWEYRLFGLFDARLQWGGGTHVVEKEKPRCALYLSYPGQSAKMSPSRRCGPAPMIT